jgi:hypothetical protein
MRSHGGRIDSTLGRIPQCGGENFPLILADSPHTFSALAAHARVHATFEPHSTLVPLAATGMKSAPQAVTTRGQQHSALAIQTRKKEHSP